MTLRWKKVRTPIVNMAIKNMFTTDRGNGRPPPPSQHKPRSIEKVKNNFMLIRISIQHCPELKTWKTITSSEHTYTQYYYLLFTIYTAELTPFSLKSSVPHTNFVLVLGTGGAAVALEHASDFGRRGVLRRHKRDRVTTADHGDDGYSGGSGGGGEITAPKCCSWHRLTTRACIIYVWCSIESPGNRRRNVIQYYDIKHCSSSYTNM